jgi:hypothetical protein
MTANTGVKGNCLRWGGRGRGSLIPTTGITSLTRVGAWLPSLIIKTSGNLNINAAVGGPGGGSYPAVRYYNLGPPPNKSGMKVTIHNKHQ